jgi:predicted neuraminidase
MTARRRVPFVSFLFLALAVFVPAALRGRTLPPPAFAVGNPQIAKDGAQWESRFLPAAPGAPSVHAASLVPLSSGRMLAVWYGGSREGARDAAVYQSRFEAGAWSPPLRIADPGRTQADVGRTVRKIGNPVVCRDSQGRLHLFYVSVSVGGWAGSALNHKVSRDEGTTWSPARRIVAGPFLNLSTLVKGAPLLLEDGSLLVPAYHEFIGKFPELIRIGPGGEVLEKTRIGRGRAALQPSVVPLDRFRALAFLRHTGPGTRRVKLSETRDGGARWSAPLPLELPNPDAAVSALRLADGTLLLAYNPSEDGRSSLALAVSADGRTFETAAVLERDPDPQAEYSYPFLALQDGRIHLVYTWRRSAIRHIVFTPDRIGKARP